MKNRKLTIRAVAIASVLGIFATVTTNTAHGFANVANASIARSYIFTNDWQAGVLPTNGGAAQQTLGKFTIRNYLYKVNSVDPGYDYYSVLTTIDWNVSQYSYTTGDASAKLTISSNVSAYGGTFFESSATQTSTSCTDFPPIGYTYFSFGITLQPKLCGSTSITRTAESATAATWYTKDVLKTSHWEEVYSQKVLKGQKPTYKVTLTSPYFTSYYDPSFPRWVNTQYWMTSYSTFTAP
jgi:hypothetical protein